MKNLNVASNTHAMTAQPLSKTPQVVIACLLLACLTVAFAPYAKAVNLVQNGEFSQFTQGGRNQTISWDNGLTKAVLADWTNTGYYTSVYGPNAAETIGADGILRLWGPKNGSQNGFTDVSPNQVNDPTANFLAFDTEPNNHYRAAFYQTINTGLVQGDHYVLSYHWAASEYTEQSGATESGFTVMLGSQMLVDGTIGTGLYASIPSRGFSGWYSESVAFTYDSSWGNVLNFISEGTPTGLPPVVLLDSVSLQAVPEPGTLLLAASGLLGLGSWRSWLRKR
jgi:PEP-CTERM motif